MTGVLLMLMGMVTFFAYGATTYPIAEPDLLQEIEERMFRAEERIEEEARRIREGIRKLRPVFFSSVPRSERSYVYEVDMEYTLEFDIPRVDGKGNVVGILYPKGFKFNPLKHIPNVPPTLVIFNPKAESEVRYVEKILKEKGGELMLIASDVGAFEAMERFKRPVYYLHRDMVRRLRIKHSLSVVSWDKERGVAVVEVLGRDVLERESE